MNYCTSATCVGWIALLDSHLGNPRAICSPGQHRARYPPVVLFTPGQTSPTVVERIVLPKSFPNPSSCWHSGRGDAEHNISPPTWLFSSRCEVGETER